MQLIDFNRYFKIKGLMKNGRFLDDKSVTFDAEKAENVPASEMRFNTAKSMGKESKMPHNSPTGEGTTLNILRKFNVVLDSLSQLAANDNASKTTNSNSDDKTNVLSAPTVASTSLLFRVKNKEVIDGSYKNVQFYKAINDNFTKDATTTILRAI